MLAANSFFSPISRSLTAFVWAFGTIAAASEMPTDQSSSAVEPEADAAPRWVLKYRFREGEVLRYQTSQQVTQQAVAPAGRKTDISKVQQRRTFTVTDVLENGHAKAAMQFDFVRMECQTDDNDPIVYESSMPADQVPRQFRSVAKGLSGAAPEFNLQVSGTPLTEDGIEDVAESGGACFMIPLPDHAVKVGDYWSSKIAVKVRLAPGVLRKLNLQRSYRLKQVKDGIAEISFFTSVETPVKSPNVKALLLQATPKGKIRFDIEQGRVLERELSFDNYVLGAIGPNTMLSAQGRTTEVLLTDDDEVATLTN